MSWNYIRTQVEVRHVATPGTAAEPSYTFTSAMKSGMYWKHSTDNSLVNQFDKGEIRFSIDGQDKVIIREDNVETKHELHTTAINATGRVTGADLVTTGSLTANGNVTLGGNVTLNGGSIAANNATLINASNAQILAAGLTVSGNIGASGTLHSDGDFTTLGAITSGGAVTSAGGFSATSGSIDAPGNITTTAGELRGKVKTKIEEVDDTTFHPASKTYQVALTEATTQTRDYLYTHENAGGTAANATGLTYNPHSGSLICFKLIANSIQSYDTNTAGPNQTVFDVASSGKSQAYVDVLSDEDSNGNRITMIDSANRTLTATTVTGNLDGEIKMTAPLPAQDTDFNFLFGNLGGANASTSLTYETPTGHSLTYNPTTEIANLGKAIVVPQFEYKDWTSPVETENDVYTVTLAHISTDDNGTLDTLVTAGTYDYARIKSNNYFRFKPRSGRSGIGNDKPELILGKFPTIGTIDLAACTYVRATDTAGLLSADQTVQHKVLFGSGSVNTTNYESNQQPRTDETNFLYRPSTGTLTVSNVTGDLAGDVTGSTPGTVLLDRANSKLNGYSTAVEMTAQLSSNVNYNLLLANLGGAQASGTSTDKKPLASSALTYNSSTQTLAVTNVTASTFTGDVKGDVLDTSNTVIVDVNAATFNGNANTATTATGSQAVDMSVVGNDATYNLLFSDLGGSSASNSSNEEPKASTSLLYNPSTNIISGDPFLEGTSDKAKIRIVGAASGTTYYNVMLAGAGTTGTGNKYMSADHGTFRYDKYSSTLEVPNITCSNDIVANSFDGSITLNNLSNPTTHCNLLLGFGTGSKDVFVHHDTLIYDESTTTLTVPKISADIVNASNNTRVDSDGQVYAASVGASTAGYSVLYGSGNAGGLVGLRLQPASDVKLKFYPRRNDANNNAQLDLGYLEAPNLYLSTSTGGIVDSNGNQRLNSDGEIYQESVTSSNTDYGVIFGGTTTGVHSLKNHATYFSYNPGSSQATTGTLSVPNVTCSNNVTASTFTGDVTGDLTGDVTGNVAGNVTGNVVGNLAGDVLATTPGSLLVDRTNSCFKGYSTAVEMAAGMSGNVDYNLLFANLGGATANGTFTDKKPLATSLTYNPSTEIINLGKASVLPRFQYRDWSSSPQETEHDVYAIASMQISRANSGSLETLVTAGTFDYATLRSNNYLRFMPNSDQSGIGSDKPEIIVGNAPLTIGTLTAAACTHVRATDVANMATLIKETEHKVFFGAGAVSTDDESNQLTRTDENQFLYQPSTGSLFAQHFRPKHEQYIFISPRHVRGDDDGTNHKIGIFDTAPEPNLEGALRNIRTSSTDMYAFLEQIPAYWKITGYFLKCTDYSNNDTNPPAMSTDYARLCSKSLISGADTFDELQAIVWNSEKGVGSNSGEITVASRDEFYWESRSGSNNAGFGKQLIVKFKLDNATAFHGGWFKFQPY